MYLPKWLSLSGAALCGALLLSGCCTTRSRTTSTGASFKGPLGLQLYSLRGEMTKDVPATLAKVQGLGIHFVELAGTYNMTAPDFLALLAKHNLKAVSGHFNFDMYRTNAAGVAAQAKALGLSYAGCAWIPHSGEFDEAEARTAIAVFNAAGKVLAEHGIKFFYHTHGYEFQPHQGGTLFDLMMAETDPRWVRYQMDTFWIVHPNQDPVALLLKYGKRFELMHIKDMKAGTERNLTGKSNVNNDAEVGKGVLNWPGILEAAQRVGVKWYFIEDESDDVLQHLPGSIKFLESVKF